MDVTSDQMMAEYQQEKAWKEDWLKRILITVELDGTVTLKGIPYRDFTNIETAAALNCYDSEKGTTGEAREHYRHMLALLNSIQAVKAQALKEHNRVYGKWEHRYYSFASRWSGPRWKWNRFCKAIREFFARMRRE